MHPDSVLDAIPREWLVAIAMAVSATFGLQIAIAWISRAWRRHLLNARMTRAIDGEKEAISLLRDHGFEIEGSQVAANYSIEVDAAPVTIALRADYLVRKKGARFVAEVKTGLFAPKIETATTRRQLLEYGIAFDVDGVLLVDPEARRIHAVRFPTREKAAPRSRAFGWTVLAAVLVVLVVLAQK